MRFVFILFAWVATLAPTATSADQLDTSMLEQFTPSGTELSAADSVALAYLAKGWLIAGDRPRADAILDELERRGRDAFGIRRAHAYFPPLRTEPNPADTVYTVTVAQVADAFRVAGRTKALAVALAEIDAIPLTTAGRCWSYSAPDVEAGCVHNVNAITIAFLSRLGRNVDAQAAYEQATMINGGTWYYWEHSPSGYWAYKKVSDAGHLGWSAFEMIATDNATLRTLGLQAASWLSRTYDEAKEPHFAYYAVAAAKIAAGIGGGCEMASVLPNWAARITDKDADQKSRQWGAFVHVWAQTKCG